MCWEWTGGTHNIVFYEKPSGATVEGDARERNPGDFDHVFNVVGTYKYRCTVIGHSSINPATGACSDMCGTVTVTEVGATAAPPTPPAPTPTATTTAAAEEEDSTDYTPVVVGGVALVLVGGTALAVTTGAAVGGAAVASTQTRGSC